jgi:hypothetical protein
MFPKVFLKILPEKIQNFLQLLVVYTKCCKSEDALYLKVKMPCIQVRNEKEEQGMNLRDIVLNYLADNEKGMQQLITWWFLNDVMKESMILWREQLTLLFHSCSLMLRISR